MKELVEAGKVVPVIDKRYRLTGLTTVQGEVYRERVQWAVALVKSGLTYCRIPFYNDHRNEGASRCGRCGRVPYGNTVP